MGMRGTDQEIRALATAPLPAARIGRRNGLAARKAESCFRVLIETAPSVVICLSGDGRILEFNAKAEQLFKYKRVEVLGKDFFELLVPAQKRATVAGIVDRVINANEISSFEDSVIDSDGVQHTIVWNLNSLIDQANNTVGTIAVGQDMTELREARAALRKATAQLSAEQSALEQKDIALREVLHQIETEKRKLASDIQANIERVILPIVRKLADKTGSVEGSLIAMLQSSLAEMTSPFANRLESRFGNLTPRELEVCNLVKSGLTSKEIANVLVSSPETVRSQRKKIRRKLGIANSDRSLSSFLQLVGDTQDAAAVDPRQ